MDDFMFLIIIFVILSGPLAFLVLSLLMVDSISSFVMLYWLFIRWYGIIL